MTSSVDNMPAIPGVCEAPSRATSEPTPEGG